MLAITDRRSTTPDRLRLSQPAASAMLLRAVNLIRWRQLDDEWVVFLPGNGLLTALDSFNATVLDSLERGAQSAEAVALMLARDADLPLTPALTAKIAQVLATLVSAGLAQPVEP